MSYWQNFLLIFIFVAAADACWSMYFHNIKEHRSIRAGLWGAAITLIGAFTTINIVSDLSFVIPAVLGGFVGTVVTVEYNKRKTS